MIKQLELASHMSLVTHALPKRALRVICDKALLFYIMLEKGCGLKRVVIAEILEVSSQANYLLDRL